MTALATLNPIPQYFDLDGSPLDGGKLYFGLPNQNPETAPITVYWDAAATQPAAQPIRTLNGFTARAGTPAIVYTTQDYSLTVRDKRGRLVLSAPNSADFGNASTILGQLAAYIASVASSIGSSLVGFIAAGVGAVLRTLQDKNRDIVSIKDFGAVGDGVADDTVAINAALTASKHVIVPAGMTCLISSTIAVPVGKRLSMLGGLGNTMNQYPASYFIKKASMTTVGITLAERAWVDGGGLICQDGNTGDGVQLLNNSAKLSHFLVHKAGGNGVRVGQDAGANTNSFELQHVTSQWNGQNGFFIHDGKLNVGADANAGTLTQCFAQYNGASGFLLQHCFWNTLINCLSEVNTGYGIYLSGANDGTGLPQCRYITVIGGDFNEGNVAGQMFDESYFSTFINPDPANVPVNAPGTLPGSGRRNTLASQGGTQLVGGTVKTLNNAAYAWMVDDATGANMSYPLVLKKTTGGGNGQGAGLSWNLNDGSTQYNQAGSVRVLQYTAGQFGMVLSGYKSGAVLDLLELNPNANSINPATDNTLACGVASKRWAGGATSVAFTVTSDVSTKQDIQALTAAEKAVAAQLKSLMKRYRLKDEVAKLGDDATVHIGALAQDVRAAFVSGGLDPDRYAMNSVSTWQDEDGTEHTLLGLVYEELFAFVMAAG